MSVKTIYKLFTDSSYLSDHKRIDPQKYFFIYTMKGKGQIIVDGNSHLTESNSLIIINAKLSLKYWCVGPEWNFWLFEFKSNEILIPPNKIQPVLFNNTDLMLCGLALEEIKHENTLLATAYFQALYYSACKKVESSITSYEFQIIDAALSYMRGNLSAFSVSDLCSCLHIEERTFRNIFSEFMKTSPKKYFETLRLEESKRYLESTNLRISQIASRLGFSSSGHFSTTFRKVYNIAPAQYRVTFSLPKAPPAKE